MPKPVRTLYDRIRSGDLKVHRLSPELHRFWLGVDKNGPVHPVYGRCWVWTGLCVEFGHGFFQTLRRKVYAHRYSFSVHRGAVPPELCVLHKCDNPPCVNPAHLFLGTRVDNNTDRFLKGRDGDHKGTKNGRALLTPEDVLEIRRKYGAGDTSYSKLAVEYNVSRSTVEAIVKRRNWSHL